MTTHRDPQGRPTVFERLPPGAAQAHSVGRLDLTSEGCCCSPTTAPWRGAWNCPPPDGPGVTGYGCMVSRMRKLWPAWPGRGDRGGPNGPDYAGLDARKGDNAWLSVSLREGRNREVRRVMAHLGLTVTRLIRVAYGPFQLGVLPRGAVEELPARVLRDQLPKQEPAHG